jgi:hypothetical protein
MASPGLRVTPSGVKFNIINIVNKWNIIFYKHLF